MKTRMLALIGCLMLVVSPVYAQEKPVKGEKTLKLSTPEMHPEWALQVTPYVWMTGLKGKISPFKHGPRTKIKKSFSDVWEDLELAGFTGVWGRYERYVFSADVMYVNTDDSKTIGPVSLPNLPPAIIDGNVDSRQFMTTLQAGYRVHSTPDFTVDMLAGVRYWDISNKVEVSALGMSRSHKENFSWVDPVIGARLFNKINDKLSVQVQGDIGGFSAGADFTWSVLGTVNYVATDNLSLSAGYKIMDVDYSNGGHEYDVRLKGPVVGLTWRF